MITARWGGQHGRGRRQRPLEVPPGRPGVLLCSDELHPGRWEGGSQIQSILASEEDGNVACQRLLDAANANGGPDNITVVLLRAEAELGPSRARGAPLIGFRSDEATQELPSTSTAAARSAPLPRRPSRAPDSAARPPATSTARSRSTPEALRSLDRGHGRPTPRRSYAGGGGGARVRGAGRRPAGGDPRGRRMAACQCARVTVGVDGNEAAALLPRWR